MNTFLDYDDNVLVLNQENARMEQQIVKLVETLEWIADPRKRDHKEPDKYTECACIMNKANEALEEYRKSI